MFWQISFWNDLIFVEKLKEQNVFWPLLICFFEKRASRLKKNLVVDVCATIQIF